MPIPNVQIYNPSDPLTLGAHQAEGAAATQNAETSRANQETLAKYHDEQILDLKVKQVMQRAGGDPEGAANMANADPELQKRLGGPVKFTGWTPEGNTFQVGDAYVVRQPNGEVKPIPQPKPPTIGQEMGATFRDKLTPDQQVETTMHGRRGSDRGITVQTLDEQGNAVVQVVGPEFRGKVGAAAGAGKQNIGNVEARVLSKYLNPASKPQMTPEESRVVDKVLADPDIATATHLIQSDFSMATKSATEKAEAISKLVKSIREIRGTGAAAGPSTPTPYKGTKLDPTQLQKMEKQGYSADELKTMGFEVGE